MQEAVDDAEVGLLRQVGLPVTVASIVRWGGWE